MKIYVPRTFSWRLTDQEALVFDFLLENGSATYAQLELLDIKNPRAVINKLRIYGLEIITAPASYIMRDCGERQICKPLHYEVDQSTFGEGVEYV